MPKKREDTIVQPSISTHQKAWTRAQSAFYLNIGISTFDKLGIPFIRIGRSVRYFQEDLDNFLRKNCAGKNK
jgi:hypothetical protein